MECSIDNSLVCIVRTAARRTSLVLLGGACERPSAACVFALFSGVCCIQISGNKKIDFSTLFEVHEDPSVCEYQYQQRMFFECGKHLVPCKFNMIHLMGENRFRVVQLKC